MPSDPILTAPTAPLRTRAPWYKRWWGIVTIILLFFFLVIGVAMTFYVGHLAWLIRTGQVSPEQLMIQRTAGSAAHQAQLPTLASADDPSFGPIDAQVVVVEFSDFQCPFCGETFPVVKEILADYGDRVRFIYRDFPIPSLHPQALTAALAAECAHEQGLFWPMHDKIFENQDTLSTENLKRWAVQIGANSLQFGRCLDSQKYFAEVEQDFQEGVAAGVSATPTFFINGRRIEGAIPYSTFEQMIVSELGSK